MPSLRHIFLTTVFFFISLLSPISSFAVTEFSTDISSSYLISQEGVANVSHQISLTNNLSHIYPTVYNLAITGKDLDKIKTRVQDLDIAPSVETSSNITTIHIPIHNPNIGKDQSTNISIDYQTASFVEKVGPNYTLTIPKMARGNEAKSFVREVSVPDTLPSLSYSSLPPQTEKEEGGVKLYTFVGSGDQALTLHFGTEAAYDLKLDYILKNPETSDALSELALPPDTSYQRIILNSLIPEPLEVVVDPDGNLLARYNLKALESKEIQADLTIIVSPIPKYFDPSTSNPLGATKYFEQTDQIKKLATNLKTPENLYNYLLTNLTYDYSQITAQKRLGASAALNSPNSAICTEFTDLFVSTARSMGIASRAIIGYAYTTNASLRPTQLDTDILHAYPEYLNPATKVWTAVDPTWGSTTGGSDYFTRLDFGHIAFVRWGNDSSYPLPAGSYRDKNSLKQISLAVQNEVPALPSPSYKVISDSDNSYLINTGKAAIVGQELDINDQSIKVSYLPPYGKLPINNQSQNLAQKTLIMIMASIIFALILIYFAYKFWRKKIKK